MDSEQQKSNFLLNKIEGLERLISQKQLEIDYLNKFLELQSEGFGIDLKKKAEEILAIQSVRDQQK